MAENTPNKPDDKNPVPASETEKNKNVAPVNEPITADGKAPENKEPEKAAAQGAEKAAPGELFTAEEKRKIEEALSSDSVAVADKNVSNTKAKAAAEKNNAPSKVVRFNADKKVAEKDGAAKEDKTPGSGLSPADQKKKETQEEALKAMDEKAAFYDKNKTASKKTAPGKEKSPAKKEEKQEPDDGLPTLAERKAKLEQDLREKYGIPKSGKTAEPFVIPETEQVVRIPHEKLKPFKDHPFIVDKTTMKFIAFVASIRAQGVTQPAVVRPSGKDQYEIISGHRRDAGSVAAEIPYTPCIIRALNDDQAIQQMVEDNINHRDISDMELARALQKQLDSIKRQGARETLAGKDLAVDADENIGKRSNQIIAERNGMSVKQVQRYIALNNLTPALQEYVDGKPTADGKKVMQLKFTPAFELSYLKPENQDYVAVSIEGQQSMPSLSQVQRMRELDKNNQLKPDIIDGILMEQKKEVDKVILSQAELSQYFGRDQTPRDMKDKIIELLEQYKAQQKDISAPEKKTADKEK